MYTIRIALKRPNNSMSLFLRMYVCRIAISIICLRQESEEDGQSASTGSSSLLLLTVTRSGGRVITKVECC